MGSNPIRHPINSNRRLTTESRLFYSYSMDTKKQILEFMDEHPHMVISSLNNQGKPQSAVVGFGSNSDLQIIFGTSKKSRKARNITKNGSVSVVIGWDDLGTIQLEGAARPLIDDEIDKFTEVYFIKNPSARLYKDDPDEQYFLITPAWLRYTDVSKNPWAMTELQF